MNIRHNRVNIPEVHTRSTQDGLDIEVKTNEEETQNKTVNF